MEQGATNEATRKAGSTTKESLALYIPGVVTVIWMFEWDNDKNARNSKKHSLTFDEASLIFEGPTLSWIDERFDYGEERTITIGLIREVVPVAVVHTNRLGKIRIISARLANRHERRLYDEYLREAS